MLVVTMNMDTVLQGTVYISLLLPFVFLLLLYIYTFRLCPKYGEYFQEFLMSDTMQQHYNTTTKPLLDKISSAINFTVGTNTTLTHLQTV